MNNNPFFTDFIPSIIQPQSIVYLHFDSVEVLEECKHYDKARVANWIFGVKNE
jgi:hypothetical protein